MGNSGKKILGPRIDIQALPRGFWEAVQPSPMEESLQQFLPSYLHNSFQIRETHSLNLPEIGFSGSLSQWFGSQRWCASIDTWETGTNDPRGFHGVSLPASLPVEGNQVDSLPLILKKTEGRTQCFHLTKNKDEEKFLSCFRKLLHFGEVLRGIIWAG